MMEYNSGAILLVVSTGLLYILWNTNSMRASIATTTMVITLFIISILHAIFGEVFCLFIIGTVLSVLVWRVIPSSKIDIWEKEYP